MIKFIGDRVITKNEDDIYIRIRDWKKSYAHFSWNKNESFEDFAKKYCCGGVVNKYEHKFFKLKNKNFFSEIASWEVTDKNNKKYYLISFFDRISFDILHTCFCIPFFKYELTRLYNSYLIYCDFVNEIPENYQRCSKRRKYAFKNDSRRYFFRRIDYKRKVCQI